MNRVINYLNQICCQVYANLGVVKLDIDGCYLQLHEKSPPDLFPEKLFEN